MFPDYSIYPQYDFAVAMTSRGCPNGCAFRHVGAKEGLCAVKVANVSDFWDGQKRIEVLDPNITACREKRDLFRQYRETKAAINFNQGLDIRLLDDEDIDDLKCRNFASENKVGEMPPRPYSLVSYHMQAAGRIPVLKRSCPDRGSMSAALSKFIMRSLTFISASSIILDSPK